MKLGMNWRHSGIATVLACLALVVSTPLAFADHNTNLGVLPIQSTLSGKTYGQWGDEWWKWAVGQTDADVSKCRNESGSVWFLGAPTVGTCDVPAATAVMFPTFNVEWSSLEGQCPLPVQPSGTSYQALLACARAQADHLTNSEAQGNAKAWVRADVDGKALDNLERYRAHTTPDPFTFTAVPNNFVLVPVGSGISVADGFWIILRPLRPGKHTVHFAASVPFPELGFTYTTEATYDLVVHQ